MTGVSKVSPLQSPRHCCASACLACGTSICFSCRFRVKPRAEGANRFLFWVFVSGIIQIHTGSKPGSCSNATTAMQTTRKCTPRALKGCTYSGGGGLCRGKAVDESFEPLLSKDPRGSPWARESSDAPDVDPNEPCQQCLNGSISGKCPTALEGCTGLPHLPRSAPRCTRS